MKVRSALDFTVKALVELYFHQLFDLFLLIDPYVCSLGAFLLPAEFLAHKLYIIGVFRAT